MQFLSDVYLRCAECNGRRYRGEVLEVKLALGRARGEVDRRRARDDGRRGARLLRGPRRRARALAAARRRRARVPDARASGADAVGRRGAAAEARGRARRRRRERRARCSSSTSRRRACTSPTSRSSSRLSTGSSRPGTRSSSSSTTSTSSRPPTGSSTSAPKAATAAAPSSPKALRRGPRGRHRPHGAALALRRGARSRGARAEAGTREGLARRRDVPGLDRAAWRATDVAHAAYSGRIHGGPGRPSLQRDARSRCDDADRFDAQRDRDRGAREHNLRERRLWRFRATSSR